MKWWRQVIWDVVITGLMIAGLLTANMVIFYLLLIYSILLLVIRISVMTGTKYDKKKFRTSVPNWFFHALYGLNLLVLLLAGWYLLLILWAVIWYLSYKSIQS